MTDKSKTCSHESSSRMIVREARLDDDEKICDLILRNSVVGGISSTMDCKPSFFNAIDVEGFMHRVAVAESNHQIVGVVSMSKRKVFINEISTDIGYIGSLRIDSSFRSTTILARLIHITKKWHHEGFGVQYYLSAIPKGNVSARNIMTSGRAGLPTSTDIGILYNAAIPIFKRRVPPPPNGLQVVRGSAVGAARIAEFLNRTGKEKQLFPVYTADDIMAEGGILRGLHLDDFYVALDGDHILGVSACWDQLPFRRMLITGYPWYLRCLKYVSAPLARFWNMAPIPNPGEPLRNVFASCIAVKENNKQIFELLLNTLLHHLHNKGKAFLVVGLMESDPLMSVLNKYFHIPARTFIDVASWDGPDVLSKLKGRIPYIELGGL
jgi:hypothetical protein